MEGGREEIMICRRGVVEYFLANNCVKARRGMIDLSR